MTLADVRIESKSKAIATLLLILARAAPLNTASGIQGSSAHAAARRNKRQTCALPIPVLALRIDNKYLAVKIQQHVCASIPIVPFHRSKVIIN